MATPAEAPSKDKGGKKAKAHQVEKKAEQAGKAEGKARIKYVNSMPRDEAVAYSFAELDRDGYLACLSRVPVYEATGRVDFPAAVDAVIGRILTSP